MHHDDQEFEDEVTVIENERPNIGRVLGFAILGYAIVACAAYFFLFQLSPADLLDEDAAAEANADIVSAYPPAAYLTPENDTLLTAQQMAEANLQAVHTAVELATLLGNEPQIATIYIHPSMLDDSNRTILKQQYTNGRLIVALNTPLSQLAQTLDMTPTQPDLPLEEFVNGTAVAAVKQRETGAPLEFVATYAQFEQIPAVLSGLR